MTTNLRRFKPQNEIVDSLRGLSALIVCAYHGREIFWIGLKASLEREGFSLATLTAPLVFGGAPVAWFFVISGYCIHRAYVDKSARSLHLQRYAVNRALRIYPVLIAALLFTFLADSVTSAMVGVDRRINDRSALAFLVNLVAVQGLVGEPYGSNGPLWSLAVEMQIYCLYPLLLYSWRVAGPRRTFLLIALFSFLCAIFLSARYVFFGPYLWVWCLGMVVAEIEAGKEGPESGWFVVFGVIFSAFGCVVFFVAPVYSFHFWGAGFACALVWPVSKELPFALGRVGGALGEISFSLYVVHMPFLIMLNALVYGGVRQASILPAVGGIIAAVLVAIAFYWLIEFPSERVRVSVTARIKEC